MLRILHFLLPPEKLVKLSKEGATDFGEYLVDFET